MAKKTSLGNKNFGVHGTFLKMENVQSNFGTPHLPHHDSHESKKLHPKHYHII
jgi:hypothetical protein